MLIFEIFVLTESQYDYILVSITVIRCLSLIFSLCCLNEIFTKLGWVFLLRCFRSNTALRQILIEL